jgi:hypothetical protein
MKTGKAPDLGVGESATLFQESQYPQAHRFLVQGQFRIHRGPPSQAIC